MAKQNAKDALANGALIVRPERLDWMSDPWRSWYVRWRRLRHRQLVAEPLCRLCLERGITTAATVVDHIEPHKGDWNAFILGRLQSLCTDCHNGRKKFLDQRGYSPDVGDDGRPVDPRHPANQHKSRTRA